LLTAIAIPLPGFLAFQIEAEPRLTPFLKWPGGKTQELPSIAALAPPLAGRFIDPFVGGGSVLLATPSDVPAVVNDACRDLVGLYAAASTQDPAFRSAVEALASAWDSLTDLPDLYADLAGAFLTGSTPATSAALERNSAVLLGLADSAGPGLAALFASRVERELLAKFDRMRGVQGRVGRSLSAGDLEANIEGSVRSSLYMSVRARYNAPRLADTWNAFRLADFLFLRELTYAAMFRFNAKDEFNVPYGGVTYNRKSLADKTALLFSSRLLERLSNTVFRCQDFEAFLDVTSPAGADFVFVDPPYDSDFSAYDNMAFDGIDQRRLEATLARLPARVMVVIKDTPAIRSLYNADRWHVEQAAKTYMWTIKSRNDRETTHLTIRNYNFGS
jgi:DNA adenine methylase